MARQLLERAAGDMTGRGGVGFSAMVTVNIPEERKVMFTEAWRLLWNGFYDAEFHGVDWPAIHDKYEPLAMAAYTFQVPGAGHIAALAKVRFPNLTTILGGYHASALQEQTLTEYPALDYVVFGEGEETKVEVKNPKEVSSYSLQNPSDEDTGYCSHKKEGYQVQLMETYQDEKSDEEPAPPDLITYIDVEPANCSDSDAALPAIE